MMSRFGAVTLDIYHVRGLPVVSSFRCDCKPYQRGNIIDRAVWTWNKRFDMAERECLTMGIQPTPILVRKAFDCSGLNSF